MSLLAIFFRYFLWHYTLAWRDMDRIAANGLWFLWHFFSIPILARTLISPWKRLHEERKPGFDLQEIFARFIVNTLMRAFGFFARLVVIAIGTLSIVLGVLLALLTAALWLAVPFFLVGLFVRGILLLFP